jgi:hypothetical protein
MSCREIEGTGLKRRGLNHGCCIIIRSTNQSLYEISYMICLHLCKPTAVLMTVFKLQRIELSALRDVTLRDVNIRRR